MALRLRPATLEDWARLWDWRKDPDVAAVSETRGDFTLMDHLRWLRATVASRKGVHLFVAEETENFERDEVGTGRVDMAKGTATLSLSLDARHRGHGKGTELVRLLCAEAQRLGAKRETARVMVANKASLRAFAANGFLPVKQEGEFAVLEAVGVYDGAER